MHKLSLRKFLIWLLSTDSELKFFQYYLFLLSIIPLFSIAQTCTGSFGDPVVNITFGSGVNPGPTSAPNYTYTSINCPNDGSYTIVSSTAGCFNNNWHTLTEDHTPGDERGYMMLVNASNSPGEFYKQTINDLCPGTTYEFAAYVVNVLQLRATGIKPNLTFRIESDAGSLLGTYSTGDIAESATPKWEKYGMVFTTGPGISRIVLKIINNAPGGNGNDLALDDITFRPCGPTIQAGSAVGQSEILLCEGQNSRVSLTAQVSSGYANPAFQWQVNNSSGWEDIPGANSESTEVLVSSSLAGNLQYRVTAAESYNINSVKCRVVSNPINVSIIPKPTVNAGPDKSTLQNKPVQLEAMVTGNNLAYLWTPSLYLDDPTRLNPKATPAENITYTLQVIDGCNISVKDEVFVRVFMEIAISNTFTPNGDGINDTWIIPGLNSYPEARIQIFNRFGSLVYQSDGYDKTWDGMYKGKILADGTYYYLIDLRNNQVFSGSVNIIK